MVLRKRLLFLFKLHQSLSVSERRWLYGGLIIGGIFIATPFWLLWQSHFSQIPADGGVLREGVYQSINTFNPFLTTNQSEKAIANLLFGRLMVDDGRGGFDYRLAKDIKVSENGLKYVVELYDDHVWSNGEKITSDDVIFSFQLLGRYGQEEIRNLFGEVTVERLDRTQISFRLKLKDNFFINKLHQLPIVSKNIWQRLNPDQWLTREEELITVTSGPFKISKVSPDHTEIILERNPLYQPRPHLDRVVIKSYPDLRSAVEGLRLREIDAIGGVPANVVRTAISHRLKLERIVLPRVVGIFFNARRNQGLDISYLNRQINRQAIVDDIFSGEAEPAVGMFSQSMRKLLSLPDKVVSSSTPPRTIDAASPLEIIVPENYFFQRIPEALKGIVPITLKVENPETINTSIIPNKQYQAIIFGINYNLPPNFTPFFFENSPFNLINTARPSLTRLLQRLALEDVEPRAQAQVLQELEREILATNQVIFLVNPYYLYILPRGLNGYKFDFLRQPEERFSSISDWHFSTKTKWR